MIYQYEYLVYPGTIEITEEQKEKLNREELHKLIVKKGKEAIKNNKGGYEVNLIDVIED